MLALISLFYLGFIGLIIASFWRLFEKAGQPGWAALIPFYNLYIMTKVIDKPNWFIMFFIPLINIYYAIMLHFEMAKVFGKDASFGIGLFLLGFIFYPLLAFGDAEYQGVGGAQHSFGTLDQPMNIADELHKLDELFKRGVITFEEFERRKAKLMQ